MEYQASHPLVRLEPQTVGDPEGGRRQCGPDPRAAQRYREQRAPGNRVSRGERVVKNGLGIGEEAEQRPATEDQRRLQAEALPPQGGVTIEDHGVFGHSMFRDVRGSSGVSAFRSVKRAPTPDGGRRIAPAATQGRHSLVGRLYWETTAPFADALSTMISVSRSEIGRRHPPSLFTPSRISTSRSGKYAIQVWNPT